MNVSARRLAIASLCFFPGTAASAVGATASFKASAKYCRAFETDDAARPIPASLAPLAEKALHLALEAVRAGGFYRCAQGHLLVCAIGANEPCGKANSRRSIPGAADFCRRNPGARVIPMVVTGHDTIYSWSCVGSAATPGPPVEKLDKQGFFSRYWKKID